MKTSVKTFIQIVAVFLLLNTIAMQNAQAKCKITNVHNTLEKMQKWLHEHENGTSNSAAAVEAGVIEISCTIVTEGIGEVIGLCEAFGAATHYGTHKGIEWLIEESHNHDWASDICKKADKFSERTIAVKNNLQNTKVGFAALLRERQYRAKTVSHGKKGYIDLGEHKENFTGRVKVTIKLKKKMDIDRFFNDIMPGDTLSVSHKDGDYRLNSNKNLHKSSIFIHNNLKTQDVKCTAVITRGLDEHKKVIANKKNHIYIMDRDNFSGVVKVKIVRKLKKDIDRVVHDVIPGDIITINYKNGEYHVRSNKDKSKSSFFIQNNLKTQAIKVTALTDGIDLHKNLKPGEKGHIYIWNKGFNGDIRIEVNRKGEKFYKSKANKHLKVSDVKKGDIIKVFYSKSSFKVKEKDGVLQINDIDKLDKTAQETLKDDVEKLLKEYRYRIKRTSK